VIGSDPWRWDMGWERKTQVRWKEEKIGGESRGGEMVLMETGRESLKVNRKEMRRLEVLKEL